jgi:thioesterase domain-containing protein
VSLEQLDRFFQVYRTNALARKTHVPKPLLGQAVLFRPEQDLLPSPDDLTLGWQDIAANKVDVQFVPGNHFTMLKKPNVQILADHIKSYLKFHIT